MLKIDQIRGRIWAKSQIRPSLTKSVDNLGNLFHNMLYHKVN